MVRRCPTHPLQALNFAVHPHIWSTWITLAFALKLFNCVNVSFVPGPPSYMCKSFNSIKAPSADLHQALTFTPQVVSEVPYAPVPPSCMQQSLSAV
eukprot:scaffold21574_cov20-Tisochrysis_lutea.AAC.1